MMVRSKWSYRFFNGSCARVEGREEPIMVLRTRVRVVTALREENKLLGSAVMAVASRWRLESEVRLINDEGSAPAARMVSSCKSHDVVTYLVYCCLR
jgi:hypothetical protein